MISFSNYLSNQKKIAENSVLLFDFIFLFKFLTPYFKQKGLKSVKRKKDF
jgi:hypothetical protein